MRISDWSSDVCSSDLAVQMEPFTTLAGIVEKDTGVEPFDAPKAELDAIAAGKGARYRMESLGDVPVNFLSDVDTTGGNSGSPTLNAKGALGGLLFDGNYESLSAGWIFNPELTSSIPVDEIGRTACRDRVGEYV